MKIIRKLAVRKRMIYSINTSNDKGISRNVKKRIDAALHNTFKEFPELMGFIDEISFDKKLLENEIARASYSKDKIKLKLNWKIFSNEQLLDNLLNICSEGLTDKRELEDYLKHEMYHFLEFKYTIKVNTHNNIINYEKVYEELAMYKYSKEIIHESCNSWFLDLRNDIIESEISEYATFSYSEAVAEAGSGGNSKLCKEIVKLVNKKWRKL